MLIDANLLLYATDSSSVHHERSARWLTAALRGSRRMAIPWQSLGAFLRIGTNPRIFAKPLTAGQAWGCVQRWLDAEPTWIPPAGERTAAILGDIVAAHHVTASLVPDAMLAALAVEHGLVVMSADTDFARFPEARWENPIAG